MKKLRNGFKNRQSNSKFEYYYDLEDDWNLVEASFAKQYGIRRNDLGLLRYDEFITLLNGMMPDTPLGNIISIRSETDNDIIKNFNTSQKKIYDEWQLRKYEDVEDDKEKYNKEMDDLSKTLSSLFGKK